MRLCCLCGAANGLTEENAAIVAAGKSLGKARWTGPRGRTVSKLAVSENHWTLAPTRMPNFGSGSADSSTDGPSLCVLSSITGHWWQHLVVGESRAPPVPGVPIRRPRRRLFLIRNISTAPKDIVIIWMIDFGRGRNNNEALSIR